MSHFGVREYKSEIWMFEFIYSAIRLCDEFLALFKHLWKSDLFEKIIRIIRNILLIKKGRRNIIRKWFVQVIKTNRFIEPIYRVYYDILLVIIAIQGDGFM